MTGGAGREGVTGVSTGKKGGEGAWIASEGCGGECAYETGGGRERREGEGEDLRGERGGVGGDGGTGGGDWQPTVKRCETCIHI